jgi:hypothetical protein
MAQKKFNSYNALKKQLQRREVASYGATATFLLEWCMAPKENLINSQAVIAAKACKEGEFSAWRAQLEKLGYLTCSIEKFKNGKERWSYSPGPALRPFINKEKMKQDVVATMSDINQLRAEFEEKLATLVKMIVDKYHPPGGQEKYKVYSENQDGLIDLFQSGGTKRLPFNPH